MRSKTLKYTLHNNALIGRAMSKIRAFHRNAYRYSSLLTPSSSLNSPEVKR